MKKYLKLLSLAAGLCGAVACSSSGGDTSSSTGGPGSTGSSGGSGSPTASATGGTPTATGGNGGNSTGGSSTGGTTTGAPQPTTYPCVDGGNAYQPTNPPAGITSCWCNPGIGIADPTDAGAQIVNGCPLAGSTPDTNIPQPPPAGGESLPLYDGGGFPLPPPGT